MQPHRSRIALDGWVFEVEAVDGDTVTVARFTGYDFEQRTVTLAEAEAHCLHAPSRYFAWWAMDDTVQERLWIACCDCGAVRRAED